MLVAATAGLRGNQLTQVLSIRVGAIALQASRAFSRQWYQVATWNQLC